MGAAPLTSDSLGTALRALRETSGLTGDVVARRASMSAGKLSKIENGRVRPTIQDGGALTSPRRPHPSRPQGLIATQVRPCRDRA
ncbi:helix-turn-helix domain-containing protein [Streptomyces sp. NPDC004752]